MKIIINGETAEVNGSSGGAATDAKLVKRVDEVEFTANSIADAMYRQPTCTRYSKTVSITAALSSATVGSLLGDTVLAGLTSAGTDSEGNSQYDFMLNGVKVGTYTKNTKLSKIVDDINGSETAGVNVSYSGTDNKFTFTTKNPGKDYGIEMGEGLADAMFGPPADSDRSGDSFADTFNMGWLRDDETTSIKACFPSYELTVPSAISKTTTVAEVVAAINRYTAGQEIAYYNRYTGRIAAKDKSGTPVDIVLKDEFGDPIEPGPSSQPPTDYTAGTDAVFVGIKVNGELIPVTDKVVSISVQGKLTGTKGQVVGFDAQGKAVAQDAPQTGLSQEEADGRYLQLTGGTLTGLMNIVFGDSGASLILSYPNNSRYTVITPTLISTSQVQIKENPINPMDVATKGYVDDAVGDIASILDALNGEVV